MAIPPSALRFLPAAVACVLLAGCAAPTGPVQVTRFHAPEPVALGRGIVRVEPAPGQPNDMELQAYSAAIAQELGKLGYTLARPGETADIGPDTGQVALVTLEQQRFKPTRAHGPVSVGLGGGGGSYGTAAGVGIGIDLSGGPKEQVATRLSVTIRERPSGKSLWEGRAEFSVRANSPLAQTQAGAAKMAQALFKGFPGRSGETIQVR
ncbi:hypothetical protein WSK_1209 [Novosphingobium sp. Rr 2-17]|uniref:DUF4136 domain-containing protein n=1 Tax=Novosphingobium sp. Rr 2-17 TaxID=555793 RepID=UPI000269AB11|nr:DUF4136 domain-containing protein [Novosphingobium sp. Rr 2-17]EIZ80176.1 hypothetical protein WSK_1209 [Novosphingobium sp. Rr 2-17]